MAFQILRYRETVEDEGLWEAKDLKIPVYNGAYIPYQAFSCTYTQSFCRVWHARLQDVSDSLALQADLHVTYLLDQGDQLF